MLREQDFLDPDQDHQAVLESLEIHFEKVTEISKKAEKYAYYGVELNWKLYNSPSTLKFNEIFELHNFIQNIINLLTIQQSYTKYYNTHSVLTLKNINLEELEEFLLITNKDLEVFNGIFPGNEMVKRLTEEIKTIQSKLVVLKVLDNP